MNESKFTETNYLDLISCDLTYVALVLRLNRVNR